MKIHEGRPSLDAEVGDIIERSSGKRYRITDCRREGDGLILVVRPVEKKPPVRGWLWALVSAVVSAVVTWRICS